MSPKVRLCYLNGKTYNLGRFSNIEDAANAYKEKEKDLFGDFCREKQL
jgi:hypothetical protein